MGDFKVEYEFDVFEEAGVDKSLIAPKDRPDAVSECAALVIDQVTQYMDSQVSPVAGHGKFPALSKKYKAWKRAQGGSGVPDLELFGDLKEGLRISKLGGGLLKLKVIPSQSGKADGHCNHSGSSELPLRRFIPDPDDDDGFKASINKGMREILAKYFKGNE